MSGIKRFRAPIGKRIKLSSYDPEYTSKYRRRRDVRKQMLKVQEELIELQELLYAENKHALLIVLQTVDAGGKDGTVKHVMGAINPQGCDVVNFKVPSDEEAAHDFLWRAHRAAPRIGKIKIFNRSYYEDVLVVRVHDVISQKVAEQRYRQINDFERMLTENNITVLKFFLHISKDEQKERFEDRLNRPDKHWKFSSADLRERRYWSDYIKVYEDVFTNCNTKYAPWHIIPANNKWYRDLVVGKIIRNALRKLDMKYPEPEIDLSNIKVDD